MLIGITGGTGFIGRPLVERHLAAGDAVRLLTRRAEDDPAIPAGVQIFHGDLNGDIDFITSFVNGLDVLYHCAGEIVDQRKMHDLHVRGTEKLCQAASNTVDHWVQLSSVGAYGAFLAGTVSEETSLNPLGVYETTKTESDRLVIEASAKGGFSFSMLRPCKVMGRQMRDRSLLQLIGFINKGLFFFIGPPGASFNYIHVNNVVDALILCAKNPAAKGRIYNICDHFKIEDAVAVISRELGKKTPNLRVPEFPARLLGKTFRGFSGFPLTEGRIDGLVTRVLYSSGRLQNELGYRPVVTMEEGLKEMVAEWKRIAMCSQMVENGR